MARKLLPEVALEMERQVWKLRMQSWNQARIAEELGIGETAVSRMLKKMRGRLATTYAAEAAELRAEQTAQLQEVAAAALAAWKASLQPEETHSVRKIRGRSQPGHKTTMEEAGQKSMDLVAVELSEEAVEEHSLRSQSGNAAFLREFREALADVRKIWGLDAPQRADITSNGEAVKWYVNVDVDRI